MKDPYVGGGRWAGGGSGAVGWVLALASLSVPAPGAEPPAVPPPACQAPAVPEQFEDPAAQNRFVDAARVYERCMHEYIDARRDDVRRHTEAGNRAAEAFNRFVTAAAAIKPPPER